MESRLKTPLTNSWHQCEIFDKSNSFLHFCKHCDIFLGYSLPKNAPTPLKMPPIARKYYRSSNHEESLHMRIDHEKNLEHMLRKQHENRFYNQEASHLVVRPKIMDFMRKVHEKFEKESETLYKAIVFMDSVFSRHQIVYDKIEIIVLLCLHISSKFDESFSSYDPAKSFFKYAQRSFGFDEIIILEKQLIRILDFQLDVQSPFHFLNFFNSRGVVCDVDIHGLIQVYTPFKPQSTQQKLLENTNLNHSNQGDLVRLLDQLIKGVNFNLLHTKGDSVKLQISSEDLKFLINILELGSEMFQIESGNSNLDFNQLAKQTMSKETQGISGNRIFRELKDCYEDPLWGSFIEILFFKLRKEKGENASEIENLAGKKFDINLKEINNIWTHLNKSRLHQNTNKFDPNQMLFKTNGTLGDLERPNKTPIHNNNFHGRDSFLSNTSFVPLINSTSIIAEPIEEAKSEIKFPDNNFPKSEELRQNSNTSFEIFETKELGFHNFEFTISSNLETITRLLNCLRFNKEGLPVGLVEVCCSNFENIYEIILGATSEVYSLNKFTSIAVAVSILYLSRKLMNFQEVWSEDLMALTGLSENDIKGCVEHILKDPVLYQLVNNMKKNFEFEQQESVYGNRKVISFKNILKMYRNKARKVVQDFKRFKSSVKGQMLLLFLSKQNLSCVKVEQTCLLLNNNIKTANNSEVFNLKEEKHSKFVAFPIGKEIILEKVNKENSCL